MRDVTRIIQRLNSIRTRLESAAHSVPPDLWRKPPRPSAWSAAEVTAHLTMVEGAITEGAIKLLRGGPRSVPLWKRLHLPVWLAGWRGIRVKTPIPLDPTLLAEKEVMLARLAGLRQRTLALLEENRDRDLSAYRRPHPFFGSLNLYQWFEVVAYHEARHTKQIREIVESFQ
jgi:hypothetical protein